VKRDLYAEVSHRTIAELELGAAPWVKPWSAPPGQNVPQNAVTNRPTCGGEGIWTSVRARVRASSGITWRRQSVVFCAFLDTGPMGGSGGHGVASTDRGEGTSGSR
jgi:antirestriction protein ArdC